MKQCIFVIAFFCVLIFAGCERNYERTIWVNPDVECCGIKDPLNNLEWLKEWYEDSYFNEELVLGAKIYGEFILLYQNKYIGHIDLSHFNNGMYIIQIKTDEGNFSFKQIVNNY